MRISNAMVEIITFGYQEGPPEGDWEIIDTRFLPNPHASPFLKGKIGTDPELQDWLVVRPICQRFLEKLLESRPELLALGCYAGLHRSVGLGELHSAALRRLQIPHSLTHRELGITKTYEGES
jgi:RNase adaptor protein for sRNA GlmZ degradation